MANRYVTRLIGIPPTCTKINLEEEFMQKNLGFKTLFFASRDGIHSAGYAFIEFFSEKDMKQFQMNYVATHHGDVLYNNRR